MPSPRRITFGRVAAILATLAGALLLAGVVVWVVHVLSSSNDSDAAPRSTGQASAATAAPAAHAARLRPMYWGATIEYSGGQAPWQMGTVGTFSHVAGKQLSLISWGSQFYSPQFCGGYCPFQTANFNKVRSYGAVPIFSWSPDPAVRHMDRNIANGSQDRYITQWARAAKAWGHPFFLRFAWEMNGRWFPWGVGGRGVTNNGYYNRPSDWVAMYRHVHNIFGRVGARNVTWVWCPNWTAAPYTYTPVSRFYPGNRYVDWTCIDGYNAGNPWLSFTRIYQSSYRTIVRHIAPSKPMMLGEVSSTEAGGSKAAWIRKMFSALASDFPKVRAIVWFEGRNLGPGNRHDWVVESSRSSTRAFRRGIGQRAFRGNRFSHLRGDPIRPPG
jgi:hypothetical protein